VREEERLAHIAELACGRFGAEEEKSQEREKDGTSGVHGGGYFAPHGTNNNFWVFTDGPAHHLPDGRFASRGALVELFYLPHARTAFSF
jgi:hypothetical protein